MSSRPNRRPLRNTNRSRRVIDSDRDDTPVPKGLQSKTSADFWHPPNRFHQLPRPQTTFAQRLPNNSIRQLDDKSIRKRCQALRNLSPARQSTSFLSLPGEIRNLIYRLVIPKTRMLITRNQPQKELAKTRSFWSNETQKVKKPHLRLGHHLDRWQEKDGLQISMNLLLACRQVHNDVERFLYSQTLFCFDSPKVLNKFLNGASKTGIQAITKLELFDQGYGNPELSEHDKWQHKYYMQWHKTCERTGTEMVGLQHLKLDAYLQQWPYNYTDCKPSPVWKKAFIQLAPNRLPCVEIRLQHNMLHQNPWFMKEMSRKLEDEMMTTEGCKKRDRREAEIVLELLRKGKATNASTKKAESTKVSPPAARRALVIKLQDLDEQTPTTSHKVRSKGLEGFSRLNIIDPSSVETCVFDWE